MTKLLFTLPILLIGTAADAQRPRVAPAAAPAALTIAAEHEPGARLRIRGRVLDHTGKAVAGASLYVFQTDARGFYAPNNARAENEARIHGYLRTDQKGEFDVFTIRPGHYPNSTLVQHVHFFVNAPNASEKVFEVIFTDDAKLTDQIRDDAKKPNSFYSLCTPEKRNGVEQCEVTVQLTRR
jgi:protocatechuate 3,4-dioxygenase beta subunit